MNGLCARSCGALGGSCRGRNQCPFLRTLVLLYPSGLYLIETSQPGRVRMTETIEAAAEAPSSLAPYNSQRFGFAAGVAAATVMVLVIVLLRVLSGVVSLPEVVAEGLLARMPGALFSAVLDSLQHAAKPLFYLAIVIGLILVGGLHGRPGWRVACAVGRRGRQRRCGRAGRGVGTRGGIDAQRGSIRSQAAVARDHANRRFLHGLQELHRPERFGWHLAPEDRWAGRSTNGAQPARAQTA